MEAAKIREELLLTKQTLESGFLKPDQVALELNKAVELAGQYPAKGNGFFKVADAMKEIAQLAREESGNPLVIEEMLNQAVRDVDGRKVAVLIRAGADVEREINGERPVDALNALITDMAGRQLTADQQQSYGQVFSQVMAQSPLLTEEEKVASAGNFQMYVNYFYGTNVSPEDEKYPVLEEGLKAQLQEVQERKSGTLITDALELMETPTLHLVAAVVSEKEGQNEKFSDVMMDIQSTATVAGRANEKSSAVRQAQQRESDEGRGI